MILQSSLMVFLNEADRMEILRPIEKPSGLPKSTAHGEYLMTLVREGPPFGIHIIISTTTVQGLTSVIDPRQTLPYFAHRIALQMSDEESFIYRRDRKAAELQNRGQRPIAALALDLQTNRSTRFKPLLAEPGVLNHLAEWNANMKAKSSAV